MNTPKVTEHNGHVAVRIATAEQRDESLRKAQKAISVIPPENIEEWERQTKIPNQTTVDAGGPIVLTTASTKAATRARRQAVERNVIIPVLADSQQEIVSDDTSKRRVWNDPYAHQLSADGMRETMAESTL